MPKEKVSCEFCGRDTSNKCRICGICLSNEHDQQYASAAVSPWSDYAEQLDCYDENSMGPKTSEERFGFNWVEDGPSRKVE
jgi:hypothetical protein